MNFSCFENTTGSAFNLVTLLSGDVLTYLLGGLLYGGLPTHVVLVSDSEKTQVDEAGIRLM